MSLLTKILLSVGGMLVAAALAFIIYTQIQNGKRQAAIEAQMVEQKTLMDGIVRSQTQYTTKADMDKFITDNGVNLKAIQKDLDKLSADVTAVNIIVAESLGQKETNIPSTGTGTPNPKPPKPTTCPDGTACPNADPYGYQVKTQLLTVNEDFGNIKIPFGTIGFSAWLAAPWSIDILPREYHVANVVGTDENQRMYFYNKFSVKVGDKQYDLPIKTAATEQIYPEARWSWWNPRLFVGVDGGVTLNPVHGEFTPSLDVGIMSYGQYKTQPDFSMLQVGVGYGTVSRHVEFAITPVAYNIGKHIPLMNNTYVGPSLHVSPSGEFSVMGGIRVAL